MNRDTEKLRILSTQTPNSLRKRGIKKVMANTLPKSVGEHAMKTFVLLFKEELLERLKKNK